MKKTRSLKSTLSLRKDTVRHLNLKDLRRAIGGCDTTTATTEAPLVASTQAPCKPAI